MSCGAILPSAAWPRFLMNMMVSTIVRITTSVPPKLRASSRRNVESNNIVGSLFCPGNYGLPSSDRRAVRACRPRGRRARSRRRHQGGRRAGRAVARTHRQRRQRRRPGAEEGQAALPLSPDGCRRQAPRRRRRRRRFGEGIQGGGRARPGRAEEQRRGHDRRRRRHQPRPGRGRGRGERRRRGRCRLSLHPHQAERAARPGSRRA